MMSESTCLSFWLIMNFDEVIDTNLTKMNASKIFINCMEVLMALSGSIILCVNVFITMEATVCSKALLFSSCQLKTTSDDKMIGWMDPVSIKIQH